MNNRTDFAKKISSLALSHCERAVAFLWYYRNSQEFDERSATELASDLHDEGFPKPNVTKLNAALHKSKYVIKGKSKGAFQLDLRKIDELNSEYNIFLKIKKHIPDKIIIPEALVAKTRNYIEKIVDQINICYDLGVYDSCAVMMRRLIESLIIDIYISGKRQEEIKVDSSFFGLERLIIYITNDKLINLSRGAYQIMCDVKQCGDTAAHDRVYITQQVDIDDIKFKYRTLIQELLTLAKIIK